MNYYILPKNNSEISINANFIKDEFLNPYISQSLVYFLNMTNKQLSGEKSCSLNITNKIVNTYNVAQHKNVCVLIFLFFYL